MAAAAASLEFEKAALLRDQIMELKNGTGISKIEPKRRPGKVSYVKKTDGVTVGGQQVESTPRRPMKYRRPGGERARD